MGYDRWAVDAAWDRLVADAEKRQH